MKYHERYFGLFLLLILGGTVQAQDSSVQQMEKVTIKKVIRIVLPPDQFPDGSGRYTADMTLTIRNDNGYKLGLKDFNFALKMKGVCNQERPMDVGTVRSGDTALIMEPNSEKDFIISVYLGSDMGEVFRRLAGMMNIVGNPDNEVCMNLEGRCKVGVEGSRGWYYQDAFEVNLRFQPQVQREVLVE